MIKWTLPCNYDGVLKEIAMKKLLLWMVALVALPGGGSYRLHGICRDHAPPFMPPADRRI